MKRRQAVLVAVAVVAALFVAVSPGAKPASAATTAQVILSDAANYSDSEGSTTISSSDPDLSRTGWSGRISSLRIRGGISVAVYSQPNYTGTCDTFVALDPWLGNNRIGNDHIASIRLFYNCAGPVVDPVVVDMTAVHGPSDAIQCPVNYVKREMDLNATAGGDFVYLCLRYESKATAGDSALSTVETTASLFSSASCFSGGSRVNVDLNVGAGGQFVYFCYWTLGHVYPNPEFRVSERLRDVQFVTNDGVVLLDRLLAKCVDAFDDVVIGAVDRDLVHLVTGDLNDSVLGADQIYACTLNYDFARAEPPDLTPPAITFAGSTPAPDAAGWNKTPVTLTWTCSDSGGVVSPQVTRTLSTEGAHQSATATCEDTAGNMSSDTQTGINIDSTPPAITFTNRTLPNANGWNNADVAVRWTCSDALSGVVRPVEVESVTTEGANQPAIGTCEDLAGNTASDTQTGINIDKTAPTLAGTVSPAANAFGWFRGDVTVEWNCDDAGGSGLDGNCPANSTIIGEGVGRLAAQSIRDRAGNSTNASVAVLIDRTPPEISAPTLTPPANSNGWNSGDVTVTWMCSDALSGVFGQSTTQVVTGEGGDLSATGTCQDRADNPASNTATGIKIDRTAPVLTASATTADGAPYLPGTWTNQNVTVTFTCTDDLSGVASVAVPQTLSAHGADQHVDGGCVDNAGNHAEASLGGINIDKTPPAVTCSADPATLWPPDHRLVPVSVSVQINDDLSGPGAFSLVSVTSSEPDNGRGDGDVTGDIQGFRLGAADIDGLLRAERSGGGDGRIYTLTYQGTDAGGNTATCQATVNVAHDQSR
jgi:hypothetical protein